MEEGGTRAPERQCGLPPGESGGPHCVPLGTGVKGLLGLLSEQRHGWLPHTECRTRGSWETAPEGNEGFVDAVQGLHPGCPGVLDVFVGALLPVVLSSTTARRRPAQVSSRMSPETAWNGSRGEMGGRIRTGADAASGVAVCCGEVGLVFGVVGVQQRLENAELAYLITLVGE